MILSAEYDTMNDRGRNLSLSVDMEHETMCFSVHAFDHKAGTHCKKEFSELPAAAACFKAWGGMYNS